MRLTRDAPAFLQMVEANKGIIYKVANAYCHQADNRKDLIQEILLQLWLSFPKYREEYKLSTWIYRIALNVSISFYRKEHRRDVYNYPLADRLLYLPADTAGGFPQGAVDQLYEFIRALKEIDRAVMLLYLEAHSQDEIAEVLGLTVTNVSTKVGRIKQQLKQAFEFHKIK